MHPTTKRFQRCREPPGRDEHPRNNILSGVRLRCCSVGQGRGRGAELGGRAGERRLLPTWLERSHSSRCFRCWQEHHSPRHPCSLRGSSCQPALRAALGIHQQSSLVAEMRMRSFCERLRSDGGLLQALLQKPKCCALLCRHVSQGSAADRGSHST